MFNMYTHWLSGTASPRPLKHWVLILDIKYVGSSCDSWSMMGVSIISINVYIYNILIKIDQNWINIFHSIFPRDLPFWDLQIIYDIPFAHRIFNPIPSHEILVG
jgi:hypothetical protein